MKIMKIIRRTTKDESYKAFLDYYIFQHRSFTINIAHAQRYLGITDRAFWQLIDNFDADFREFIKITLTESPSRGMDTLTFNEL